MSVQKTPTGWIVRWRENGKQRARRFNLKADAIAWDDEVRRRSRLGPLAVQQLTVAGPTLGDWIAQRWAPEHGSTLARRTIAGYSDSFARHIEPTLGQVPLRDLTVSRLRQWQADRLDAGVSVSQILQARTFLSSVLRHAAESEAIPANPMRLVRAPRKPPEKQVRPLAPATVEAIRAVLAAPMRREVGASTDGKRKRRAHTVPDPRPAHHRVRDAALVSLLAYGGLRPAEALALTWGNVGERTILVEGSADSDGSIKETKGRKSRSVRLLAPLALDLKAWRLAAGRPRPDALVFPRADGAAWTSEDWANWRGGTWRRACAAAGLDTVPRVYDLRHSFVSLLLAEGRSVHHVAEQAGHAPQLTWNRYGHVIAELDGCERIDAEAEIRRARSQNCAQIVRREAVAG